MSLAEDSVGVPEALYPPTPTAVPAPLPLLRFLATFVRNPLETLTQSTYHDDITVVRRNGRTTLWVTSPSLIEEILLKQHESFPKTQIERRIFESTLGNGILTANGHDWRWQRRSAAPLFRHQELLDHVPAMSAAAEAQLRRWRTDALGDVRPVDRDMTDTTFDVFTRTILAGADPRHGEAIKEASARYLSWISWDVAWALVGVPRWVWHPGTLPTRRGAHQLRQAVARIIADRRTRSSEEGHDILGRLLAARHPDTGAPMPDELLIDNLLTFIEAGHETTAKALTWTLYLLARSPHWQRRIREEINTVCGKEPVSAAHIEGLTQTTAVLKESMRLYPPASVLTRETAGPVELGGVHLEKGAVVIIPIYAVHRHRKLWDDPDRFDPLRFTPQAEATRHRAQFLPFGFGPRTCIGMSFAMLEATAILATLVRGAHFAWDGKHLPQPVSRVTLQPSGGMPLAVELLE